MALEAKLIDSLTKAGVATILALGMLGFGYMLLKHQWEEDKHRHIQDDVLMDNMERQTVALEKLVEIYSGN